MPGVFQLLMQRIDVGVSISWGDEHLILTAAPAPRQPLLPLGQLCVASWAVERCGCPLDIG